MIKLISVIGHGTNLIHHFIKHYQKFVDEINFVVYESELYPDLSKDVNNIIKVYKNVNIVKIHRDRIFDWERVTMLYNYVTNKEPNTWWVVADIDEFHLYSTSLKTIIENCEERGQDIVRGGFIDRLGPNGEFSKIEYDTDIFKQFPLAGFFRYPMSGANPNKICILKGHVELTNGQHYAKINGQTTWRWQGWNHPLINNLTTVQVHHFKWDNTSIERIKAVADNKQEYSYSNEYGKMFKTLIKNNNKIDIDNPDYMFVDTKGIDTFETYNKWNNLIKKIISI